ncbi:MYXO-CTERM domain-containing protein [Stackebrandtia soli]
MANIYCVRGSERNDAHAPRSPWRIIARIATAARVVVCVLAACVLTIPALVDTPWSGGPELRLVDDSGKDPSPVPSYSPSPSPSPSPSSNTPTPPPAKDSEPSGGGALATLRSLPLAAQAGLSVGVLALAAVALLPGRRPPASLRG